MCLLRARLSCHEGIVTGIAAGSAELNYHLTLYTHAIRGLNAVEKHSDPHYDCSGPRACG